VGEQLPWPSAETGSGGPGGLDEEFEDSLGDFDEAVAGGASGGGSEEEIDILNPTGGGSAGSPSDQPLFEEGETGEEGDMAENESVAQRAASGASGSSSSSSGGGEQAGGQQSGSASGSQDSSEQSEGDSASAAGGTGGGGAGAEQGDRAVSAASGGGAEQGGDDIILIPEDIGDGRNDDIVLRQIRDAAMNERDPVLREKLWDEYRRIKGSR
jgi:hypothetical protein